LITKNHRSLRADNDLLHVVIAGDAVNEVK